MKNVPIIGKFIIIMSAFGCFALAVASYTGIQIWNIDSRYSSLISNNVGAAIYVARGNRALQNTRAALGDMLMSRSDALNESASEEYRKSHDNFASYMSEAIKLLPSETSLSDFRSAGLQLLDVACKNAVRMGSVSVAEADIRAAQETFLSECQPQFPILSAKMTALTVELSDSINTDSDTLTAVSIRTIETTIAFIVLGLAFVLSVGFIAIRSWIANPIRSLRAVMRNLAEGDLSADVDGTNRRDEIGEMARAVQIFKDNGVKARELEIEANGVRNASEVERRRIADGDRIRAEQMLQATSGLGEGLKHLSEGNLSFQLVEAFAPDFEGLRTDFNAAVIQLADTLRSVAQAAGQIDSGTREISQSAMDLSKRTEQQAASLEETAAALDQITANVSSSSKRAEEARIIAVRANESAVQSGSVVASAVEAMEKIEHSSNQVSNIIGVIDEIAFQTNLLALNAGVEAARAGDAGKGFAVVAQEVRELAQRSAKAAKEIKDLIRNSETEVQSGVKLVSETGAALKTIETYIVTVNQHMEAIATSAKEQSVGLAEVNTAVNQMDQVTQQNAAMVEESNAASAALASEAGRLRSLIGEFQLSGNGKNGNAPGLAGQYHRPASSPARRILAKVANAFSGSEAVKEEWEAF